ncbi:MAG: leucine-rich repeat protein [Oscillospiraceae bacterium]|nr:leucine-rich repeat protein [Oscillospiraceae bacterium]
MVRSRTTKTVSFLLTFVMLLSLSAVFCFNRAYADYDGEWEYTISSGTATIIGYSGTSAEVSVPAKLGGVSVVSVSGLSQNNFKQKITSISFASGIREIGANAFNGYTALTRVSLPDTLQTIGSNAFFGCTSLAAITLPNSTSKIGDGAFSGCTSMLSAGLSGQVRELPAKMFEGCSKLSTVTLPIYLTSIGASAFANCSMLKTLSIPDGVTSIGAGAFSGCTSLSTVNMPYSLSSIGDYAFQKCTSLDTVFLCSGIKTIGEDAFSGCSLLREVYIAPTINKIGSNAFGNCSSMEKIVFGGDYVNINNALGVAITGTVYYPAKFASNWESYTKSRKTSYSAPSAVTVSGTTKLNVGGSSNLKITVNPTSGEFSNVYKIYSSNNTVASVNESGKVTAKAPGAADITVVTVSGVSKTTTVTVSPAVPEGLKATTKSTSSIDLTWKAAKGATGYNIYRASTKTGKVKKVASVLDTSYTDKGLKKGTTYYYVVAAYVTANGSEVVSEYSSKVSAAATSPAPSSVTAKKSKSGTAVIKWSKSTGASGYEVYIALKGGTFTKAATITDPSKLSYTKTGLSAGKTYNVKVRSYITVSGKKVYSSYSKTVSVKV